MPSITHVRPGKEGENLVCVEIINKTILWYCSIWRKEKKKQMTENKMHCMSSHQTVLGIKVSQLDLTQAGEWLAEHSAAGFICCPALIYRRPCHPQVNIAAPWHLTNLPTVLPWHMQKALGRRAGREKAWAWFLAYSTSVGSNASEQLCCPSGGDGPSTTSSVLQGRAFGGICAGLVSAASPCSCDNLLTWGCSSATWTARRRAILVTVASRFRRDPTAKHWRPNPTAAPVHTKRGIEWFVSVKLLLVELQVLPVAHRVQIFSGHVWQVLVAGDVRFISVMTTTWPVDEACHHPT